MVAKVAHVNEQDNQKCVIVILWAVTKPVTLTVQDNCQRTVIIKLPKNLVQNWLTIPFKILSRRDIDCAKLHSRPMNYRRYRVLQVLSYHGICSLMLSFSNENVSWESCGSSNTLQINHCDNFTFQVQPSILLWTKHLSLTVPV